MRWTSLDRIVRSQLLQAGYSIHWYAQFLKYAADTLREMTFDEMRIINTVKLTVTSYKAIQLPCDFVDFITVGIPQGQYVQPMVQSNAINPLYHYNDKGEKTEYPDIFQLDNEGNWVIDGIGFMGYNWVTWNEYNEPTGRMYGLGSFPSALGFKVLPERNEIQLDDQNAAKEIILEYVSDGQCCDAATRIDAYAQAAIETGIWDKHKQFGRQYGLGERQLAHQEHLNQRRIYRGRKNSMTIADIRNIIRGATMGAYKS